MCMLCGLKITHPSSPLAIQRGILLQKNGFTQLTIPSPLSVEYALFIGKSAQMPKHNTKNSADSFQ